MDTAFFDSKAEQWDAHQARVLRAEKIYQHIIAEISVKSNDSVLDFGCGTGLLGFHFIDSAAEVTFADTSTGIYRTKDYRRCRKNISYFFNHRQARCITSIAAF